MLQPSHPPLENAGGGGCVAASQSSMWKHFENCKLCAPKGEQTVYIH